MSFPSRSPDTVLLRSRSGIFPHRCSQLIGINPIGNINLIFRICSDRYSPSGKIHDNSSNRTHPSPKAKGPQT